MSIDTIYLDLDGVLADFVSAALTVYEKDPALSVAEWPAGDDGALYKLCGAESEEAFWEKIDEYDPDYSGRPDGSTFWTEAVQRYPWADLLWNFCEERAPTWIMSSPSRHAGSAFGKVKWIQAWKGETFRRYVIAPRKHHLGRPGALLIDDRTDVADEWTVRGGTSILFPRIWNQLHERHDRPIETIIPKLLGLEFAPLGSENKTGIGSAAE